MGLMLEKVPVDAARVIPLAPLSDLATLEEKLLARMCPHPTQEHPEVGCLLPVVARHLVQQRSLAMHHLVVAQDQDEMLMVGIEHREGDLPLMILPVDRRARDVAQGVVHPPHVPLEAESEPPLVDRLGDTRPGRGLLRDRHDPGMARVAGRVEGLEELDRLEILASAETVRNPLPGIAGIIEVEHRGDRIHPQAVDVILVEPEEGIGDQEIPHLVPPVIEDQCPPVAVLPEPRILMLVEGGAVEPGQAVCILGKMAGDPVEDHPDARLMKRVDEMTELVGRSEAAARREEIDHLIAP